MLGLGLGSIVNFRSWAIASFYIEETGTYLISCGNVEFYFVGDREFVGDPYALRSWWGQNGWFWLPIRLTKGNLRPTTLQNHACSRAGTHTLRVQFHWKFQCRLKSRDETEPMYILSPDAPSVFNPGLAFVYPSIVNGRLASPYLSFPIVNAHSAPTRSVTIRLDTLSRDTVPMSLASTTVEIMTVGRIHPGQVYALPVALRLPDLFPCFAILLEFTVEVVFEDDTTYDLPHQILLRCLDFDSEVAYKVTFLDVDGSVQYGTVRPPRKPCTEPCSIIFALHGSDVDAASPTWTNAVPSQDSAWILMPSNRDKFGYDHQGIAAWNEVRFLNTFVKDLPGVPLNMTSLYRCSAFRMLYVGHSMGGHGTLSFATHFPDRAIGILAAAAWIRFDHYVQEYTGSQSSHMDGVLKSVLEAAVAEYHTDLMAVNIKGIPFMARTGGRDTNVRPWNLRRFARLVDEVNRQPGFAIYSEIPDEKHWFDGVLSDNWVKKFLSAALHSPRPLLPTHFELRTPHVSNGGRGGIRILQFHTPTVMGSIQVERKDPSVWKMTTRNVRRFSIQSIPDVPFPSICIVDGISLECTNAERGHYHYSEASKNWQISMGEDWKRRERHLENAGPMRQIFHGPVSLIYGTQRKEETSTLAQLAVRIANLLIARGHALVHIYSDETVPASALMENVILLGGPEWNAAAVQLLSQNASLLYASAFRNFTIHICGETYIQKGTGAALLGSRTNESGDSALMLLVTGTDIEGIQNAVRVIPTFPNAEIPDYVVIDHTFLWKGSGSILAAGYWGNHWECRSDISYPRNAQVSKQWQWQKQL